MFSNVVFVVHMLHKWKFQNKKQYVYFCAQGRLYTVPARYYFDICECMVNILIKSTWNNKYSYVKENRKNARFSRKYANGSRPNSGKIKVEKRGTRYLIWCEWMHLLQLKETLEHSARKELRETQTFKFFPSFFFFA